MNYAPTSSWALARPQSNQSARFFSPKELTFRSPSGRGPKLQKVVPITELPFVERENIFSILVMGHVTQLFAVVDHHDGHNSGPNEAQQPVSVSIGSRALPATNPLLDTPATALQPGRPATVKPQQRAR